MIVSKSPNYRKLMQDLGQPLLALLVWDVLIVAAFRILHWDWVASDHIPLALYGSAIGIVVGFRNNSAYSRWWEARTIWGQIVNSSRSLARQVCATLHEDAEMHAIQRNIVYHQIAFVHALRQQLRGLDPLAEISRLVPVEHLRGEKNVPLALQRSMGSMLREARQQGLLDQWEWQQLDRTLYDLMASQGGTERIKNTPLPKQYDFFVMLFVHVYCLLLPVGMVEGLGWFTPLGSTLVGFMFLALNRIGSSLEDPFENSVYDIPLTAITGTIETNLRQMLKETELPAAQTPVRGVLW